MKYPNSGLNTKDFLIGEEVIIVDPRGAETSYKAGNFDVGDICIVVSRGEECIDTKVKKNGFPLRCYAYRFIKLPGLFRINDSVQYKDELGKIIAYEGNKFKVGFDDNESFIPENELTLMGRKKLI